MATVRGYLESALQRQQGLPPELRTDLETMERELARLQALIDQLFMLSRAEVGRLELRLGPVDAGDLAQGIVDTIAPLAWRQGRVQIVAEIAPDLPPAQADADRLAQILSNLLSNARRYTAPGGMVAVSVSAEPDWVRIDVRDTGAGIAARDVERVFEPYYQAQTGDGVDHDGAGLGLALVQELTAAMHGSVEVESTPGEGSVFTVRLPPAAAATATRARAPTLA
jgi:signal transduction histidine kinase